MTTKQRDLVRAGWLFAINAAMLFGFVAGCYVGKAFEQSNQITQKLERINRNLDTYLAK